MRVGEFISLYFPFVVLCISAVGSFISLKRWDQRFWFFLLSPMVYLIMFFIVAAIMVLPLAIFERFGVPISEPLHFGISGAVTLGIYLLNCLMFRHDGKDGIRGLAPPPRRSTGHELRKTIAQRRFEPR